MTLKLSNRAWYPFIFPIGSILLIIACWRHFAGGLEPKQWTDLFLSGVGIVAGFTYFLYKQHLDETTLFKDLFTEFNKRYDNLSDGLNTILLGPTTGDLSSKERKLLFDYFNLCSEEYLFFKTGYIDEDVWKSWRGGMDIFFKHPRINALWKSEPKDSYYGFQHV